MSSKFWSIELSKSVPVSVAIPKGYTLNLQQAAIEGGTSATVIRAETGNGHEKTITVIGTLRPGVTDQILLGNFTVTCYCIVLLVIPA